MQVTDYLLEKICLGIDEAIQRQATAKGKIFAYLDLNKNPLNTYIKGGCPIFNIAVESDDNNSTIKSRISAILCVSQNNFVSILQQGIKNGEFSSALDPAAYAFKMFAAVEGAIIMCRAMNDERPMQGLIKSLKSELESYDR